METIMDRLTHGKRSTPSAVILWEKTTAEFPGCRELQDAVGRRVIFGDWAQILPVLEKTRIRDYTVHCTCRNSLVPLLDITYQNARIEPGAIIRDGVAIGNNAVIMMGAVLNIGVSVGAQTMVDMNAVLGGGAQVGEKCHIGAGAVIAGMIEPACRQPVVIGDRVLVGANAVILEGVRVGDDAVVAAGAVVTEDVAPGTVVGGCPARFLKMKDKKTADKTGLTDGLR